MWLSMGFHDAFIVKYHEEDGGLRVLFDSEWAGKIEMWFTGDVSYNIGCRAPDSDDRWWYSGPHVKAPKRAKERLC